MKKVEHIMHKILTEISTKGRMMAKSIARNKKIAFELPPCPVCGEQLNFDLVLVKCKCQQTPETIWQYIRRVRTRER